MPNVPDLDFGADGEGKALASAVEDVPELPSRTDRGQDLFARVVVPKGDLSRQVGNDGEDRGEVAAVGTESKVDGDKPAAGGEAFGRRFPSALDEGAPRR